MYIKFNHENMLFIEIYIDDIIFGSDDDKFC